MGIKVYVNQDGNIIGIVMDMTVKPPPDATSVNSEKVARMMANPTIAQNCLFDCPFALSCETLNNALTAIGPALDALRAEEDMMTGPSTAEPPQSEAGSTG